MLVLEAKKFLRMDLPMAMVLSIAAYQNKNSSVRVSNNALVAFKWHIYVGSS